MATLDGGIDDPDGLGRPAGSGHTTEEEGWDLDAPITPGDVDTAPEST
jgi:hypothetical protein